MNAVSPRLVIEGLTIGFGGLIALQALDLTVEPGEIVGLIGPNGAGKTTVFNCISRFYTPDRGTMRFGGQDLARLAPHDLIRHGIARTFQNVELCHTMTVLENLLVGQHARLGGGLFADGMGLPSARRRESTARDRSDDVLALLDLGPYRDRVVAALPFGVRKGVELARALVSRPRLILLDEPAGGLDTHETAALADTIRRVRHSFDLSILLVEHDMSLVMGLCERIYVLDFGKLIASGSAAEIGTSPAVIEAYLGEAVDLERQTTAELGQARP